MREANLEDLGITIDNLHFEPEHEWLREFYKLCNTKQALDKFGRLEKRDLKGRSKQGHPFKENKPNIPGTLAIEETPEKEENCVLQRLVRRSNTELLHLKAKALYQNYELQESYKVCKKILTLDAFHFPTLDIYTELLVERKVN